VEAVHVELANERRIVVVFEEFGDECSSEFIFVQYNEGFTII
jgi:hypothetical protein